jgi:LytS/YehU family sensor histidine kinase
VTASHERLRRSLRHGAIAAGFSAIVAIGLGIARGGDWILQFVYAEAIGLSIWACTDFGRYLFRLDPQSNWPTGWRTAALQIGAVVGGYFIGTAIGDLYCGCSSIEMFRHSPRSLASYLVLCIAISASISYWFLSRARDQRRQREIAMAQRDAAEARLKLLESQLEPHMLFNTLANLRALIAVDPPRAQAMLDQLIAFLRATLGASRVPFHALDAEFARVADYLALMQARMGSRLETKLDLPADLATLQVPPLVLQPLVENAIKHGLEPHVGKGRIEVRAARDGNRVRLTVRDTGTGVVTGGPGPSDANALARAGTDGNTSTRFGLEQVRARLAAVYGAAASLELAPADDGEGGSRAIVTLPA